MQLSPSFACSKLIRHQSAAASSSCSSVSSLRPGPIRKKGKKKGGIFAPRLCWCYRKCVVKLRPQATTSLQLLQK